LENVGTHLPFTSRCSADVIGMQMVQKTPKSISAGLGERGQVRFPGDCHMVPLRIAALLVAPTQVSP